MHWPLVFSGQGGTVACRLSSRLTQKDCIAVDGRRGEEFERVGPPVLSADGRHIAWRAQEGATSFVVVDGRRGPSFDLMSDPAISADGTTVAYGAKEGGRWWLVVGGRKTLLDAQPAYVFLSADGRSVGYWYSEPDGSGGTRSRVVANGSPGEGFGTVGLPVFSPDGRTVAYAADAGKRQYVVVGTTKIEVDGRESDPVFSPDGRRVGYGARLDREIWWKVLDAP